MHKKKKFSSLLFMFFFFFKTLNAFAEQPKNQDDIL